MSNKAQSGFKTCDICGKQYYKGITTSSIYKVMIYNKKYVCCSWKCYNIALERKEKLKIEKANQRRQGSN